MGPSPMTSDLTRGGEIGTQTLKPTEEDSYEKTMVELRVMLSNSKEYLGPLALKKARKNSSLEPSQEVWPANNLIPSL